MRISVDTEPLTLYNNLNYPRLCHTSRYFDDKVNGFAPHASAMIFKNAFWLSIFSGLSYFPANFIADYSKTLVAGVDLKTELLSFEKTGISTDVAVFKTETTEILAFRGTYSIYDLGVSLDRFKFSIKNGFRSSKVAPIYLHTGFLTQSEIYFNYWSKIYIGSLEAYKVTQMDEPEFEQINAAFTALAIAYLTDNQTTGDNYQKAVGEMTELGLLPLGLDPELLLKNVKFWSETLAHDKAENGERAKFLETKRHASRELSLVWTFRKFRKLWLTGHSKGGAVATLFAYRLITAGIPVSGLATFGAPKAGDTTFGDYLSDLFHRLDFSKKVARVKSANDPVANMPVFMNYWAHTDLPWYFDHQGVAHLPAANFETALANSENSLNPPLFYKGAFPEEDLGFFGVNGLEASSDHSMYTYMRRLESLSFPKQLPCDRLDRSGQFLPQNY